MTRATTLIVAPTDPFSPAFGECFRLATIHDSATATARYNRKLRLDSMPALFATSAPKGFVASPRANGGSNMKTKFSFSKKPRTSIMHHRNLRRKKVGLGPLGFLSFLGITMGVLILMAMAAPSARASLETYYDFEDFNLTSDSPGLQTTSLANFNASAFIFGLGSGTQVNAVTISTNAALLPGFTDTGAPTSFTLGGLTTTGLTDVNLSLALISEGSGSFTDLNLFYSTDGGATFSANPFATVPNLTNYTTYTGPPTFSFDVSALTNGAVDNISGSNLFFGFAFSGGSSNFTRIDNIQVTAAVPEPSSYIGALLGIVGLCWYQRRRFMRLLSARSA